MNRVFKVVWSKTKGMFIVVSEIAGTWQKQTSKAVVSKKRLASLLCAVLAVGGIVTSVAASDVATADHATTADTATKAEKMDYVNVKGTSSENTADNSGAKGSNSVAIGQDARADGPNGIAIGNGAVTVSRGNDKSNNGTNSITIGTAKTAGSEILTLGTIKYVNSLYGRVNADGTIDTTKDIATIGDPVPFQDKVILMGYDTTFDANNKDILKKDTDTFLRTSAIIGHENTIKTNSVAGFGWSYGESDMYIFGGRNTIDGEDSLILGRENDVKRTRNAGSGYVNITGDRNIIRNEGNGINISGSKNRINYYKEAVWYGGDAPNNNSAEKDFGNVSDPSLHIYGSRNTLGLDLDGRKVTSGFIVGENNRLYSYNGYVFGTYNNVYASGATVFGRGNLVGIDGNTPAKGTDFLAVGLGNAVKSSYGMGIGASNTIEAKYGTALGQYNQVLGKDKAGQMSVAVGYNNTTSASASVAIGIKNNLDGAYKPITNGKASTVVGIQSVAAGERATSLGVYNTAHSTNTVALGAYNEVNGADSVTIGSFNNWHNKADGKNWIKYVSGKSSVALGAYNTNTGDYSNTIGYQNVSAGQYNSVFGALNQSNVMKGTLVGFQNFGMGYGSIIVGNQNNYLFSDPFTISGITMTGYQQPASTGILSTTMGVANLMLADNGGTYGYGNQVTGSRSYAFGATNINTGIDSFIMGYDSSIGAGTLERYQPNGEQNIRDAMVVGNHNLANISDSVALGSYATTSRDAGMRGYDPTTKAAMTDDALFTGTMTKEAYNQAKSDLTALRTAWEGEVDKLHDLRLKIQSQQYSSQDEMNQWKADYTAQKAVEKAARDAYFGKKKEMGKTAGVWEAQLAALSIGNEELGLTRQITGVAAGTKDTDAVNVAQLKRVADMVDSIEIPTIPDIPNSIMYTATNPTNGNTDSGTAADGNHVSGDGTNAPDDNRANNTVKKKSVTFTEGFNFTGGTNTTATVEENGVVTFDVKPTLTNMTSIAGNNGTLTFGSSGISLGHGGTTIIVNSDGLNIGNKYITGVAPGRTGIEYTSDAVNMGQLSALQNQVNDIDSKIMNRKPIKLENGTNTAVASREENGQTIWKVNVDLDNYVTNEVLENYVTNETLETTYVNKGELDDKLSEYAKTDASNLEANDVTKWKEKLGIINIENGTATSISYQADGDTAAKSVTLKEGFTFKGDGNIIASTGDKGEVKYTLAKELTNMDSVGGHDGKLSFNETETTLSHGTGNEATAISVGKDIRFTNGATTVKVTENGLDAGGTRIANVADGVAMSDAATVGQLRQAQGSVVQQISQVEHHLTKEIADVGALSAAMAALKPLGYNPDEKTQIMAGIGGYKGSQGVALGVAHHDNEDVMYHGGLAYSGNGVMWNAGISIRLGEQGDRKGYFLRYAPEPVKAEMARLYNEIDHLRKANATQMAMNETTDKQMTDYGSTLQAMQQSVNSLADENAALRKQNEELAKKVEWLMARVSG